MTETRLAGARIHIAGIVQGVGFRPFVFNRATGLGLTGWVRNTSSGVDIEADGSPEALATFISLLRAEAPPLARIHTLDVHERGANGYSSFEIVSSESIPGAFMPISPDVAVCPDCLRELFEPSDRRYRYPFINCTNCGPRFTIIEDIPYDRPRTTMAEFAMCPDCAAEYGDPANRRFHAQPVACPVCGPHVWLELSGHKTAERAEAIQASQELLSAGKILAIRGLGGFHLACDATNPAAVAELRRRKLRVDKAFALMMPDLLTVEAHCVVSSAERELLESRERPIVILKRRPQSRIAAEVAPGQDTLGVMLPYTPLHYLLTVDIRSQADGHPHSAILVMTSGNLSEEPIATANDEARERLGTLADGFLMHDRGIRTRCDDSVVRARDKAVYPLRRSRGYAPFPVGLPVAGPSLLAVGAELKNSFCVTRGDYAFLSHHIGDLENYETLRSFEEGIAHFERLFRVHPAALVYDKHPDYLATRYALARAQREGLLAIQVQHHHAHLAACMADQGLTGERRVIGLAFDGTGYGDDGTIWGGEVLLATYDGYRRALHLADVRMPGGNTAVREPWRMALAWLRHSGIEWGEDLAPAQVATATAQNAVRRQLERGVNAPWTSSMGRLFDAVAALVGVRQVVNYEAQAAIELEMVADPAELGIYPFEIQIDTMDPAPALRAIVADLRAGVERGQVAARFHNTVAAMAEQACCKVREDTGVNEVALSGGVWQNMTLLAQTTHRLGKSGFAVYVHRQVPTNDGGLALGQAAVATTRLARSGMV